MFVAKLSRLVIISLSIMLFVAIAGCKKPQSELAQQTWMDFMLGTFVEQRWHGENAEAAYSEIKVYLSTLEQQVSLYIDDSEISRLNRNSGASAVSLSQQSFDLLSKAVEISRETNGAFDVTVAPLTLLWNISGDSPSAPLEQEILEAKQLVSFSNIILNEDERTAFLAKEGMAVDLGAIAKGLAAEKCLDIAKKHSVSGFISVGGNIAVNGKKPDKTDFAIGIRDPHGTPSDYLHSVKLDGRTMATSGGYERYFEQDGVRYHHVLDPFTGYPAESDFSSVTVISEDGALADALATAIFVGGHELLDLYIEREDILIFAVNDKRESFTSKQFKDIVLK